MRPTFVCLAASLFTLVGVAAAPAQTQGAPPCAAPENRQFDFWLGSWNVFGSRSSFASSLS